MRDWKNKTNKLLFNPKHHLVLELLVIEKDPGMVSNFYELRMN